MDGIKLIPGKINQCNVGGDVIVVGVITQVSNLKDLYLIHSFYYPLTDMGEDEIDISQYKGDRQILTLQDATMNNKTGSCPRSILILIPEQHIDNMLLGDVVEIKARCYWCTMVHRCGGGPVGRTIRTRRIVLVYGESRKLETPTAPKPRNYSVVYTNGSGVLDRVFVLSNNNKTVTAETLGCCRQTVHSNISTDGNRKIPPKRGAPTKMTKEITLFIEARTIAEKRLPSLKLANEIKDIFNVKINRKTVDRARRKLAFRFHPPLKGVVLSTTAKTNRTAWCTKHLVEKTDFKKVIFSDESYFRLQCNNRWLWYRSGDDDETVRADKMAHPPSLMVWGGVGWNFKTKLVFIEGTVTAASYITDIIEGSGLVDEANNAFPGGFCLQQDNARPHTARTTLEYFNNNSIAILAGWPPYSPDLNIIEVVWAIMKRRVEVKNPSSIEELKVVIQSVWNELSFQTINSLVESMERRMHYVVMHHGLTIVGKLK